MKSKSKLPNADQRPHDTDDSPNDIDSRDQNQSKTPNESEDSSDLDETEDLSPDDDRWDVFILDDEDCDPLPHYGDFWLPD